MRTFYMTVVSACMIGTLMACGGPAVTAAASTQVAPGSRIPVVLELFTSEGCSSCPPADELLMQLVATQPVNGVEILALGEHVDYWDRLGWRDPFSSAMFSARQSDYAHAFHASTIYTPQVVVDGTLQAVGSDRSAVRSSVTQAARAAKGHGRIEATLAAGERVVITIALTDLPPGSGPADLFVAVTEDDLMTSVEAGENRGRALSHTSVVRALDIVDAVRSGQLTVSATTTLAIRPEWSAGHLKLVAFVQERGSRRILAAAGGPLAAAGARDTGDGRL